MIRELEAIEKAEKCIKKRTMIYQVDQKEALARKNNLLFSMYYDTPYEKWAKIRVARDKGR